MKHKLIILMLAILTAAILVALNAASYRQKESVPDSEFSPNRSTFNAGATGTQAFYTLLFETGHNVVRWQEPPSTLSTSDSKKPSVFVVAGALRRQFTEIEVEELLRWVADGGRLVLIDREPNYGLVITTANWKISFDSPEDDRIFEVDPTDQQQMVGDTAAIKPIQPTAFTQNVNAVQPSALAANIRFEHFASIEHRERGLIEVKPDQVQNETENSSADDTSNPEIISNETTPTPEETLPLALDDIESRSQMAPIVHFAGNDKNLVVDVPYGNGQIVFLSDPFIVSNGGISLVDNAQLAINLVSAGDKLIAFDEYHQGFGDDNNRFLQFFAGTPVVIIFLQVAALVGFVFYSQSRRFGRPVPESEPDRLSKLEYVAAMADLQIRTKAFDLAIENIYQDVRRRICRYFGLDNFSAKTADIAVLIAERSGLDSTKVLETLQQCEEIIRGEPTNKREVLRLATDLRLIEQKLGITRAGKTRI